MFVQSYFAVSHSHACDKGRGNIDFRLGQSLLVDDLIFLNGFLVMIRLITQPGTRKMKMDEKLSNTHLEIR